MNRAQKTNRQERGIALLTVITCLVALMVIAVPFAISMRMGQERSEVHNARLRARDTVDSILNFQKSFLVRTTESVEIENRTAELQDKTYADPDMDTLMEIQPTIAHMADALGVEASKLEDPYGLIAGAQVEDENGKVNLNSNSLFMLGNLMGLSTLSGDLEPEATTIALGDTSRFPEKGYVKVGRELIKYSGNDGGQLTGCERGVLAGKPHHGPADQHKSGSWCVNYAAWAINYYTIARNPGAYTPWTSLDVSDISQLEPDLDTEPPVLTQAFWERVKPFVTVWSKGESGATWGNAQAITEGQKLPENQTDRGDRFKFLSGYYFGTGSIIRVSESRFEEKPSGGRESSDFNLKSATILPRRMDYGLAYYVNPQGENEYQVELFNKLVRRFRGNQARIEYRVPTPINLNTAPREVLIALFANLRLRVRNNEGAITRDIAGKIADEIIRLRGNKDTAVRNMSEFRAMLSTLTDRNILSRNSRQAIFRNAVNPHDQGLTFGTAPVTFRTFDVYTIRAAAAINHQRSGSLLAKHSETRVVEIGPQVTTVKIWETQRDFEEGMWREGAAADHPLPALAQHGQREVLPVGSLRQPRANREGV
ncbi:MAG: hypothetical protein ACYTGZ_02450 [Planctomycetota bacterium]|jgi:hypothetical protein